MNVESARHNLEFCAWVDNCLYAGMVLTFVMSNSGKHFGLTPHAIGNVFKCGVSWAALRKNLGCWAGVTLVLFGMALESAQGLQIHWVPNGMARVN